MCHTIAHLRPVGHNLIIVVLSHISFPALLHQIKVTFFCSSAFFFVLWTESPRKNSYFLLPLLCQWRPLPSPDFLLMLQVSPHSLSYYILHIGNPCKAVLILPFNPSLKTTSVVMPTNLSHMTLIKQVIICDFFSAHYIIISSS